HLSGQPEESRPRAGGIYRGLAGIPTGLGKGGQPGHCRVFRASQIAAGCLEGSWRIVLARVKRSHGSDGRISFKTVVTKTLLPGGRRTCHVVLVNLTDSSCAPS